MRATGIVRRIDDLGRVVVPKEIRRTLRIKEGDPVEIYTGKEGEIMLKKYSPLGEISNYAKACADAIANSLKRPVMISDKEEIIAVSGISGKDYLGKAIHKDLEEFIDDRGVVWGKKSDESFLKILEYDDEFDEEIIQTIISEGDAVGSVMILAKKGTDSLTDIERKIVAVSSLFLAKQLEV